MSKQSSHDDLKVERRKSKRKIVKENQTTVYMYYRGKRVHNGKVTNISVTDVSYKGNVSVPIGAVVQLAFTVHCSDGLVKIHRKSAVLIRLTTDGAAFSFLRNKKKRQKSKK